MSFDVQSRRKDFADPNSVMFHPKITPEAAVAGRQTGIYPSESTGGWHLLGRSPCRIVDLEAGFFPIEPGDFLRFEPITKAEYDRLRSSTPF